MLLECKTLNHWFLVASAVCKSLANNVMLISACATSCLFVGLPHFLPLLGFNL